MTARNGSRRRTLLLVVTGLAWVIAAGLLVSFAWPVISPVRVVIYGHHGDLANWPANSIEGIRSVVDAGADGVEVDVQRSADGTFWLVHDTLDTISTATGTVAAKSDQELATIVIDGGDGYDPARHAGMELHLHTLAEVLAEFPDLPLMVDVKDTQPEAGTAIARLLRDRANVSVIVEEPQAANVKAIAPGIRVLTFKQEVFRANVDGRLMNGAGQVAWLSAAIVDLFGDVAMYVPEEATDEQMVWEFNRRWGVGLMLVNDVHAAVAWRAGLR